MESECSNWAFLKMLAYGKATTGFITLWFRKPRVCGTVWDVNVELCHEERGEEVDPI